MLCALSNLPEDDPKIQSEFNAVKDTVFEMAQGRFRDCFATNKNRNLHRTVLAYVNQMFQQISGINIITYYGAYPTIVARKICHNGATSCNNFREQYRAFELHEPSSGRSERYRVLSGIFHCYFYYRKVRQKEAHAFRSDRSERG